MFMHYSHILCKFHFVLAAQIPTAHCELRFEVTNCKIPCALSNCAIGFANMQITLDKVSRKGQKGEWRKGEGVESVLKSACCASAGQTFTLHTERERERGTRTQSAVKWSIRMPNAVSRKAAPEQKKQLETKRINGGYTHTDKPFSQVWQRGQ